MPTFIVLSEVTSGTFQEVARPTAESPFAALETVPIEKRGNRMHVVNLARVNSYILITQDNPDAEAQIVVVMEDGSLTRVNPDPPIENR